MEIGDIQHIGDGVYAKWDGYHLILMANFPDVPTVGIYLDFHVRRQLAKMLEDIDKKPSP